LNCENVIHELSDFIDGDLDAAMKREIESHLQGCKECQLAIDQTKKTIEIFCDSELVELPNDVRNRLHEAVRRKLLAAHPNEAELHRELGQDLLRQKKFQEAQQEFTLAVKLKPDFGIAYGDLAFAAGENKDYPLVIRALDARVKLLPEIPITYFLRASAYDHLRDFKNAAANYHLFLKTANGQYPDQEWQAKHRLITIEPKK